MMTKIWHNKARCRKCGDIIEAFYRHQFVTCKCKEIFVEGIDGYLKGGAKNNVDDYIDLSHYSEEE
jgi:hypothetical protein